jgi:hypothetical protein
MHANISYCLSPVHDIDSSLPTTAAEFSGEAAEDKSRSSDAALLELIESTLVVGTFEFVCNRYGVRLSCRTVGTALHSRVWKQRETMLALYHGPEAKLKTDLDLRPNIAQDSWEAERAHGCMFNHISCSRWLQLQMTKQSPCG